MNEPKRWMDEGPPPAIEQLLRAASAELPADASMSRTLTALGLGAGATGAATTASAATASTATAGAGAVSVSKAVGVVASGMLVKWGLLGGALLVAGVGGTAVVKRVAARSEARDTRAAVARYVASPSRQLGMQTHEAQSVETAPNAASTGESNAPDGASTVRAAAATSPPTTKPHKALVRAESAPAASEAPIDAERLAEEVALVDRARGALARGDAPGTLAALDDYDARFTRRKFAPEALYLRMEALLRLGRADAARSAAERLATTYPSSPNAARARQVLGASNP